MRNILLASAREKMILAKDIAHPSGPDRLPIYRKGTELTEALIERLAGMGIQSLAVSERSDNGEEDRDLQERLDALEYRFKRLDGNQLMMNLKGIVRKQLIYSMENDHGD